MKKEMLASLSLFILTACAGGGVETDPVDQAPEITSHESQDQAQISIQVDGDEINREQVEFEPGTDLYTILDENFMVESDSSDFGEFITAIEGYQEDPETNRFWMFDVNGEMATVGVSDYQPEDGDLIEFNLEEL